MTTFKFATRIGKFPEYIFASLAKVVAEVEKDSGRKVLNLGPGSPNIPPSEVYLNKRYTILCSSKYLFQYQFD